MYSIYSVYTTNCKLVWLGCHDGWSFCRCRLRVILAHNQGHTVPEPTGKILLHLMPQIVAHPPPFLIFRTWIPGGRPFIHRQESSSTRRTAVTSPNEHSQNVRSWSPSRSLSLILWLVNLPCEMAAATRLCRSTLTSSTLKSANLMSWMVWTSSSTVPLWSVACLL